MGLRSSLQRLHQRLGRDPIGQRQLAARKYQHVAHLVLQLVQALFKATGKTLLCFDRQLLFSQMTGVNQRGRQWRADLVRQRGHHAPQRRQTLVPCQLVLQAPGFCQVVKQHQLPRFSIQRASGNRQAPTINQRNLVPIVFTRGKAAGDDVTPQLTHQRQAEQFTGRRVGLAHTAAIIYHDDPAG